MMTYFVDFYYNGLHCEYSRFKAIDDLEAKRVAKEIVDENGFDYAQLSKLMAGAPEPGFHIFAIVE